MKSLRIPRWVDKAADWVSRRRWLASCAAAVAAGIGLLFWAPFLASTPIAAVVGAFFGFAINQDKITRLRGQHDLDQLRIGGLGRQLSEARDRPFTEAQTKALVSLGEGPVVGTKPLPPVPDGDVPGGDRP